MIVIAFAVVGFGLVITLGVIAAIHAKKRRETLATGAATRGWQFTREDARWIDAFTVAPFGLGHDKSAKNILTGTHDGRRFVAFDYCYHTTESTTGTDGSSSSREVSHNFGIVGIETGAHFATLSLAPEGFFSRMVGRITGRDIELESEAFNRAFTVTCEDRKFASDVLHPQQMEFLLRHPKWAFCFDRTWALSIGAGEFQLEEVDARLAYLDTVLDQIPDFVWKDAQP